MEKDRSVTVAYDASAWGKSILFIALLLAALIGIKSANADEMHLIINGRAIHFNERPGVHYNENNWGAGFQYDMGSKSDEWVPFITGSGFIDSNRNASYYAGGGIMNRSYFTIGDSKLHTDIGVVAFLMTRKGFRDGEPFFGALPAFSVGSDKVAVNMTFIPQVDPKAVPLLFFQLKISLSAFSK